MQLVKNKVFLISILIWAFITLVRIFNHVPWLDESHAWIIAEQLNLVEIFKLMKVEGHTFIWYLLLMPFAKTNFLYPYSMQILNWSFCFVSLVILWKKAPFNNFVKVLITFSFPFLAMYSVFARCYAIGIMLLFLLAAYFKDKLNRPVLYSILLVLCANTSVMAMFGAVSFGILFLYEILKNRIEWKNLKLPIGIMVFGVVLILLQLYGSDSTLIRESKGINVFSQMDFFSIIKYFLRDIIFAIPILLFLRNKRQGLFFIVSTYLMLSYCLMFLYYGNLWHHSFYYIYFIITLWIVFEVQDKSILKNFAIGVLILASFINIFPSIFCRNDEYNFVFENKDVIAAKIILKDKNLNGKPLILGNNGFLGFILLPYHRYDLKNYCEDRPFNHNSQNYPANNQICYVVDEEKNMYNTVLKADRLTEFVDKEAYFVLNINKDLFANNEGLFLQNSANELFLISIYKCFLIRKTDEVCIYKIERIEKTQELINAISKK